MRYTLGSAARFRRWWGAVPTWRHRERVRFGAWEARPSGRASAGGAWKAMPADMRALLLDARREIARCSGWGAEPPLWVAEANARATLSPGAWPQGRTEPPAPVPVEGPQIPGPENTYKCAHCGRVLGGFEAGIAYVGTAPVCHPNDDGIDCYRRVTVYGEKLGARR